jgi:hypothetical protein
MRDSQVDAYSYPGGQLVAVYVDLVDTPAALAVSPSIGVAARTPQPPPPAALPHPAPAIGYESIQSQSAQVIDVFDARTGRVEGTPLEPRLSPQGLAVDMHRRLFVAADIAIYEYFTVPRRPRRPSRTMCLRRVRSQPALTALAFTRGGRCTGDLSTGQTRRKNPRQARRRSGQRPGTR